ncbi:MAG TPA: S-methyl-5'-thioadenosine phosphorylase [Verrucomicrobiae bacterium]|nr:S-methyl-5'-thioadenosine phosphorylase [Verrucomicrobiae bacterium]
MSDGDIQIGIIGGSGLYEMPGLEKPRWQKIATPWGEPSDEIMIARLGDRNVAFLPRHGRGHRILPSELNHRANIYALKSLGVRWIVSLSAVGSLREHLEPGAFLIPSQFYDRTKRAADHTFFGGGIVAHIGFAHPVCGTLQRLLFEIAQASGPASLGGTYVNMEGPAFSTLAEAEENRRAGFDVIGMTNLGEAKCAREAEIAYATVAMVTDYDCWHPEHDHVSVSLVLECLHKNSLRAQRLVSEVIPRIPLEETCDCHRALKSAIMTPRHLWPENRVEKLRAILAPYL